MEQHAPRLLLKLFLVQLGQQARHTDLFNSQQTCTSDLPHHERHDTILMIQTIEYGIPFVQSGFLDPCFDSH